MNDIDWNEFVSAYVVNFGESERNGTSTKMVAGLDNPHIDWLFSQCFSQGRSYGKKTLALMGSVLNVFEEIDPPVTVRQMFYAMSVRNAVEKTEGGYRRVQRVLLTMRRNSMIPYSHIADNTRWMRKPTTYDGLPEFFERAQTFYRQDLWARSEDYVEIWCEKDALAGVLFEVTSRWDVPLMVSRGYSSESFTYEAAQNMEAIGKPAYVYYLGDFDPSGWQMAEDLNQKLCGFYDDVVFRRLAVNVDQVSKWDLPSRPTKKTDTRQKQFYERFGEGTPSVELDAIPPNQLRELVEGAILTHVDTDELEALELEQNAARETLEKMSESLR